MNYPVIIAPTKRQADQARTELFGGVVSRCRTISAGDETVDMQTAGYYDQTFLLLQCEGYNEFFLEEVLPVLSLGNRIFWFSRSLDT